MLIKKPADIDLQSEPPSGADLHVAAKALRHRGILAAIAGAAGFALFLGVLGWAVGSMLDPLQPNHPIYAAAALGCFGFLVFLGFSLNDLGPPITSGPVPSSMVDEALRLCSQASVCDDYRRRVIATGRELTEFELEAMRVWSRREPLLRAEAKLAAGKRQLASDKPLAQADSAS